VVEKPPQSSVVISKGKPPQSSVVEKPSISKGKLEDVVISKGKPEKDTTSAEEAAADKAATLRLADKAAKADAASAAAAGVKTLTVSKLLAQLELEHLAKQFEVLSLSLPSSLFALN